MILNTPKFHSGLPQDAQTEDFAMALTVPKLNITKNLWIDLNFCFEPFCFFVILKLSNLNLPLNFNRVEFFKCGIFNFMSFGKQVICHGNSEKQHQWDFWIVFPRHHHTYSSKLQFPYTNWFKVTEVSGSFLVCFTSVKN